MVFSLMAFLLRWMENPEEIDSKGPSLALN